MPDIENYDYKILKFVCESSKTLRLRDVTAKFDEIGRSAAIQMCQERLLFWDYSSDEPMNHNDDCFLIPTEKGKLVYKRYTYDKQLKSGECWKERIVSYILGVLTPITVYLITEYLLPLISKL